MSNRYDDIINLPHHESTIYKRMPTINRAAQFAPFAALTGYEDAIEETGRITTDRKEIDEYLKDEINNKLNFLANTLDTIPKVSITYFVADPRKEGGKYVDKIGTITKIDTNKKVIVLDSEEINIEDISDIDFENNL